MSFPHRQLICRVTNAPFEVSEEERAFLARLSELNAYLGAPLPLPTIHPWERLRRHLSWGNLFWLSRVPSAASGQPVLSRFSQGLGARVCSVDEFWSGAVDNTLCGRSYDFSRPFFEQFGELIREAVIPGLNNTNAEGSDFVNAVKNVRNCYLCFNCAEDRDCLYCCDVFGSTDLIECVSAQDCELCCGSINLTRCYHCLGCQDCQNSHDCLFCVDLIGCANCTGCTGLRNQNYMIFNEQVSADEYRNFMTQHDLMDTAVWKELKSKAESYIRSTGHRAEHLINVENCSGDYLLNSKNCRCCYYGHALEDCGYLAHCNSSKNCWFGTSFFSELTYCSTGAYNYNQLFSYVNQEGENCLYTANSFNHCAYCFGCVGLLKKSYCILNREYSKEEYFSLVRRIAAQMQQTGEWGEFFPPGTSIISYPDTLAAAYCEPITDSEATARGYVVEHSAARNTVVAPDTPAAPDNIRGINDTELVKTAFKCEATGRPYNVQRQELKLYRQLEVPLPKVHWLTRMESLMRRRPLLPDVRRAAATQR